MGSVCNLELRNLKYSPNYDNQIMEGQRMNNVAHIGEMTNGHELLVTKRDGDVLRRNDNIKTNLKEIGWTDLKRLDMARDRNQSHRFVTQKLIFTVINHAVLTNASLLMRI
jgi:hypothetical protein